MLYKSARRWMVLLLFVIISSGCSTIQNEQAAVTTAQPTPQATLISPTATLPTAVAISTATIAPTAMPTAAPPTSIPTPTALPTPTPDPWAEYAPYTIEGLRA